MGWGDPAKEGQPHTSWTSCPFSSKSQMLVTIIWPSIESSPLESCDSSGVLCVLHSVRSQIDHIFTLTHLPPPASQSAPSVIIFRALAAAKIHFENAVGTKDDGAPSPDSSRQGQRQRRGHELWSQAALTLLPTALPSWG